jgi:GT2 family glycosyltransferase
MGIKIGIVIPVLNQFEKAIDLISSIQTKHTYEVKICPNHRENKTLSAAWNDGLQWSMERHHSFTLIMNDDIVLSPDTIDHMVISFLKLEQTGSTVMVTAANIRGNQFQVDPFDLLTTKSPQGENFSENPDFSCFMVRPTIAKSVGWFDENFAPAYFEDNDYHRRILISGRKAYSDNHALMFHYGSQTQNASLWPVVPSIQFEINKAYYVNKWGGEPGKECFDHPYDNLDFTHSDWIPVAK